MGQPMAEVVDGLVIPDGTMVLEPRDLFDRCLVGAAHRAGEVMAVYSRRCVLDALVADGMDEDDALDHYGFNVSGGVGWGFPVFLLDLGDADVEDD